MRTIGSGLELDTRKVDVDGEVTAVAYERPWVVRICHWVNAISLFVLIGSGLRIFIAFPSFGPKVPQQDFLTVPKALTIGGWLAGALQGHFTFMWIFVVTGLVLYKPVHFRWLTFVFGGFHLTRIWHFAAMCGFVAFILGHLVMVLLHGWNNFVSMLSGWKKGPEYLAESSNQCKKGRLRGRGSGPYAHLWRPPWNTDGSAKRDLPSPGSASAA